MLFSFLLYYMNAKDEERGRKPSKLIHSTNEYILRAEEISQGKYGDGYERRDCLRKLGYNSEEIEYIQEQINRRIRGYK